MTATPLLNAALMAQQAPPLEEWSALPNFPLPRASLDDASAFARAEVAAGRCLMTAGQADLLAPVAILVGPAGEVQRIVPQAIGCPTVEQYTVGYLLSLTRSGGAMRPTPGWYRLTMTYRM